MPARPQGGVAPPKTHRRPIRTFSYVWCDAHCSVHDATHDVYDEGNVECCPRNWRPVYVLGEPGETF
jgi:hypothetical protein